MELYDSPDTHGLTPRSVNMYELFLDDALVLDLESCEKGRAFKIGGNSFHESNLPIPPILNFADTNRLQVLVVCGP